MSRETVPLFVSIPAVVLLALGALSLWRQAATDGVARLRRPAARPRNDQIYFIGATNVPIDRLDPALIRPGRMGRHVWFRTPSKQDRLDILDLYIGKVSHEEELDLPARRDEIARIMSGYSPAMIEQAISMGFTIAHHTLVTRADPAPPAKWSAWHPTGSETAQIKQIADQVARRYRVETGQQLVAAVPSEPRATGATGEVPLSTIAIRPDGEATATSVFLKRSDVKDVLKSPLAETISPKAPSIGKMPQRERALVNKITEPRLYNYEYQQAQDGSVVLIYNPIVLGA